jgi:hypothetical protein
VEKRQDISFGLLVDSLRRKLDEEGEHMCLAIYGRSPLTILAVDCVVKGKFVCLVLWPVYLFLWRAF